MTDTIQVRAYCHGLGDCHLIGIPRSDKDADPEKTFWILIDCGIHSSTKGGNDRLRGVVQDIARIAPRVDVVVGTHEHWDHLSGFKTADDLFVKAGEQPRPGQIEVGEVWFAWTEDPKDPLARQLDTFKDGAALALAEASMRLADDPHWSDIASGVRGMLGFVFGAAGERTRDARETLRGLAPTVRHLLPGTLAPLPEAARAIRVYVLGPPRDIKMLGLLDSAKATYHMASGGGATAMAMANAIAIGDGRLSINNDPLSPFDSGDGRALSDIFAQADMHDPDTAFLSAHYAGAGTDQDWRRIDNDWLGMSADLALQLDSRTNNSSLVLAIEIVATGRVLIFAADAQIGNWQSWADVAFPTAHGEPPVTGADLLKRAIFYKVGHHGSANATLSVNGLELMEDGDLSAFIPTDEAMAKKVGWKDIPASALLARLREKTGGRLIQSDADWVQQDGVPAQVHPGGAIRAMTVEPGLCVDLRIG